MSRINVTISTEKWEVSIFERETDNGTKLLVEVAEAQQGLNGFATLTRDDHSLINDILNFANVWIELQE
jgi:hypothetical protein